MIYAALATGALVLVVGTGFGSIRVARSRRRPVRSGMDRGRLVWSGVGAGLVGFVLLWGLTGIAWVAIPPAVAVGLLPSLYFSRQRSRRAAETTQAWPDALRDLSAAVASGMSLSRALESLAEGGPAPIRVAFADYPSLSRTIGVVPALEVMRERFADPIADRVFEVIRVAHERGGSAVPQLLADLADATADDLRVDEEIRTESLEQRINARAVFVLPWLVLVLLCAKEGPFRDFYASPGGIPVIVAGAVISGVGAVIVSRLSKQEVEPRILGGRS